MYKGLKYSNMCKKCGNDLPVGSDGYLDGKDVYCVPCWEKTNPKADSGEGKGVPCPYCKRPMGEIVMIGREYPDGTSRWIKVCMNCYTLREVVLRMKQDGMWPDRVPRPKTGEVVPSESQ